MKNFELFDKVINGEIAYRDAGVNGTIFDAYRISKEVGNNAIDFNGVIWEKDIQPIVEYMVENRIYEFTISSTFSGLIPVLAEFEKQGYQMCGITEVNAPYTDFSTGKYQRIPAIRMRG